MEHTGSRGKVTAGQMWDFTMNFITHNDLGMIHNYMMAVSNKISRRFKKLLKRTRSHMSHILVDVPQSVRHMDARIARELSRMASIRVLDTVSYRHTVSQKKSASATSKAEGPTLKQLARSRKRKLCRALKRNEMLRSKVRLMHVCSNCIVYYS